MGKVWGEAWQGTWVWTFCFFLFFLVFSMVFCSLAKTSRTQKKNKQKKFRPMGKVWAIHTQTKKPKNQKTKKPKKQKKTKNKKPKNQKNKKPKKTKKTRPNTLHLTPSPWGVQSFFFLVFCFFCFLVFCFFGLCVDSPDLAHGSELFFFGFFLCSRGFGQTAKKHGKTKKNKKPRNQKTKQNKKPKKQKNKIAHPKGRGSDAECWVLSFCFFVFLGFLVCWFFGFFGFLVWIAIADVPSTDCQALSVVALEARSIHYSTAMFAMT